MDMRRDLQRVDGVMTQVISDSATAEEFVRDPNGVLARLGLHPPASREVHDRVNRIFYAVLTNTELINLIIDHYTGFTGPVEDNTRIRDEALARGALEHSIEFDMAGADHVLRQPEVLRRIYHLTLYDLNNRRLLQEVYSTEHLDDYIERLVESVQARLPIREHPKLETWDANYGVGTGFGAVQSEVGPVATAVAIAEGLLALTVAVPVEVAGFVSPETVNNAVRGDSASVRALATVANLLQLAGEVLVYANDYERP